MKILITGSTGLLGQALTSRLAPAADIIGLSRHAPAEAQGIGHMACDLAAAARIREVVQAVQPDVVIHAQALSDVDRCELEPGLAEEQNVRATRNLISALGASRALLLALSTDYVFDGTKGSPYDEADPPNPLSVYGRSKLAAEQAVHTRPRSVVVRTSTLFGSGRTNFCDQIVSRLRHGEPIQAFVDQVTSPTFTDDLADALAELARRLADGRGAQAPRVVHIANAGGCSRLRFAHRLAELLDLRGDLIQGVAMADQHRPARRPACSALQSRELSTLIGRALRSWEDALQAYLRQRRWLN